MPRHAKKFKGVCGHAREFQAMIMTTMECKGVIGSVRESQCVPGMHRCARFHIVPSAKAFQCLPIHVREFQYVSMNVKACQGIPRYANTFQEMIGYVNVYLEIPRNSNACQDVLGAKAC